MICCVVWFFLCFPHVFHWNPTVRWLWVVRLGRGPAPSCAAGVQLMCALLLGLEQRWREFQEHIGVAALGAAGVELGQHDIHEAALAPHCHHHFSLLLLPAFRGFTPRLLCPRGIHGQLLPAHHPWLLHLIIVACKIQQASSSSAPPHNNPNAPKPE